MALPPEPQANEQQINKEKCQSKISETIYQLDILKVYKQKLILSQ